MALFMKQDFTPPVLSRKWIAIKLRPNVLIHSRTHIISILESGLMFREDSIEVESEAPSSESVWTSAGGGTGGWLTWGERGIALCGVACAVCVAPPKCFQRSLLINLSIYAAIPLSIRIVHRYISKGTSLSVLLHYMRDYLSLARRTAACLKEYRAMHKEIDSLSTILDSTDLLLRRQQSSLGVTLSRASSAVLGNAPWLRADLAWDVMEEGNAGDAGDLMKIHHAYLVVQSTLLKHIAMAHFVPPKNARNLYKNHNERIYWIHTILLEHLNVIYKENIENLDRMYRLFKNYGNKDVEVKKSGIIINNWYYSDVHSDIARANLDLKMAANKCTSLDMFLDSCAMNNQDLDIKILNKDLDNLIDIITKCLNTAQSAQMRLKKLQIKYGVEVSKENNNDNVKIKEDAVEESVVLIDDKEPETKDEVFFCIKTEDDEDPIPIASDVTTGPGKKEKETTKVVLNELKRKLVKREDLMRERERQALAKTMPELKDNLPEFPRQITLNEFGDKFGYIRKINRLKKRKSLFKNYLINHDKNAKRINFKKQYLDTKACVKDSTINEILALKSSIHSIFGSFPKKSLSEEFETVKTSSSKIFDDFDSSGLSDVENNATNKVTNESINQEIKKEEFKFSKKDLELSTSSDSDFDLSTDSSNIQLLTDVRRHRAVRKKRYPVKRLSLEKDESLKPVEYSFGTGMAIASVLQVNNKGFPLKLGNEEVFIGDGEISGDSGNDDD